MSEAPTATERAYRFAKAAILDGSLPAGELISEGQVAKPLNLSRTPVREAFLQLQAEGLLKLYPKRGALVVPVSPREVDAVIEAREVIESHAAATVVAEASSDELVDLLAAMEACIAEQVAAHEAGRELDFVDADRRFHTLLVRAGCGSILTDVYEALRDRQVRMNLGGIARIPGRSDRILTEHRALIADLQARRADAALGTLAVHLDGTRSAFVGRGRPTRA